MTRVESRWDEMRWEIAPSQWDTTVLLCFQDFPFCLSAFLPSLFLHFLPFYIWDGGCILRYFRALFETAACISSLSLLFSTVFLYYCVLFNLLSFILFIMYDCVRVIVLTCIYLYVFFLCIVWIFNCIRLKILQRSSKLSKSLAKFFPTSFYYQRKINQRDANISKIFQWTMENLSYLNLVSF